MRSTQRRSSTVISTTQKSIARKQMELPDMPKTPLSTSKSKYVEIVSMVVAMVSCAACWQARCAEVIIRRLSMCAKAWPTSSRWSSIGPAMSAKGLMEDIEWIATMKRNCTTKLNKWRAQMRTMLKRPSHHTCRGSFVAEQPWWRTTTKAQSQIEASKLIDSSRTTCSSAPSGSENPGFTRKPGDMAPSASPNAAASPGLRK
mmetsp:Transcript_41581/g.134361  ORF Transcript_41581/g.134361 Transcript_41581/m.134361 type:complete len:202 (-) Transcript_41581:496-1101(-)